MQLSHGQEREFRYIYSHRYGAASADVDLRICKALERRGLVRIHDERVQVTEDGLGWLERRAATRPAPRATRTGRLSHAVDLLEAAAPMDAEIEMGPMLAHIQDLISGLRGLARSR